ncbi:FAD-binding oxidoreductase [Alphaproteobacteria bacterium]|nr:FAD-binding oxidoreductase [Alphaproteobacteria bacterium]
MNSPLKKHNIKSLIEELSNIVGNNNILLEPEECELYSSDIFYKSKNPADIVISPRSSQEVSKAIKASTKEGFHIIPRGGGMSYTGGYSPKNPNSIIIDMSKMNSIIKINKEDMYVTVECGVTWKQLYEELKSKGLRTPYFGPFSGMHATVGGALSQNSIFYGSSIYGSAAEAVLSLEVAIHDGQLINTGSNSNIHGSTPFFRNYGPDLTGLFIGDTGSLGFKTVATLRLISFPKEQRFCSFDFTSDKDMFSAMAEIARQQLAQECYGFDPFLMGLRMKFEGLKTDINAIKNLAKSGKNFISGVSDALKVAVAGRKFMEGVNYAMHVTIEGRDERDVESSIDHINKIALNNNGVSIKNSLPKLVRANPFLPLNRLLGPNGERWVPVHVILPHSKVNKMLESLDNYFNKNKQLIEKNNIQWGYLTSTIGTTATLIEPTFFWPDSHYQIHEKYIEKSHYNKLQKFPENLEARKAMEIIREDLAEIFMNAGGVHLQIGKMYPFKENRQINTWKLIKNIKKYTDPNCMINPGSLGLDKD